MICAWFFPARLADEAAIGHNLVRSLHVGDEIVTYGGLIGKIIDIDVGQGVSHVEIADGVTIRLLTAALQHVYDPQEIARSAGMGIESEPS